MNEKEIATTLNCLTKHFIEYMHVPKREINLGHCFVWAVLANRLIPESELGWDSGHCWIRIGELLYDCDAPYGVINSYKLPVNIRYGPSSDPSPRYEGKANCVSYWKKVGKDKGVLHMRNRVLMDTIVKEVKMELGR